MNSISITRNVGRITSYQIRYSMRPTPSSITFSNRIRHWSIELLMNAFDSLSHAFDIADESPSMPSSRASCPKLRNQAD